jgi:diketogulonate reductase-like aldo/keto reductase
MRSDEMRHRLFGNTKREVAVIGQGTWYGKGDSRESAINGLRKGLDLGMTHIDTAEMYLSGRAEEWIAEALERRRKEVFLVSKVLPQNASRKGTIAACEGSLGRLKTDRLDCYLLHWRGDYPLDDTIEAFEQLLSQGKILSWGVSNFDVPDLKEAFRQSGHPGPVCDQVLYHLQERAVEHAVVPWCEKHGAALVGYSPFGHGDFPRPHTAAGRLLKQIADESKATPRQVALAFLLRWPFSFVIPKSSDIDHVVENAAADDLELTDGQIERLNKMFPLGPPVEGIPML